LSAIALAEADLTLQIEKMRRYGGSVEPIFVVRDSFRKEQLLQPLLVVERRLDPQA